MSELFLKKIKIRYLKKDKKAHHKKDQKMEEVQVFREKLQVYINNGENEQASKLLEDRIKNFSYNRDVLLTLAGVYFNLSKFDQALDVVNRILVVNPEDSVALQMTGVLMGVIGTKKEDLDLITRSLLYNDENYDSWLNKAIFEFKKEDYLSAAKSAEKAASIDPKALEPFYILGEASVKLNRFNFALQAFLKVLEINPKHMNSLVYLLTIYERTGDVANTKKIMKNILSIEGVPLPIAAVNRLGEDLLFKGNYQGSRVVMDKYKKTCDVLWRNSLFFLQYHPNVKGPELLSEHLEWAKDYMEKINENKQLSKLKYPYPTKKEHLKPVERRLYGVISSDIRVHSVAFFARSLVKSLPNVTIYCTSNRTDYITDEFKSMKNVKWEDCFNKSPLELTDLIRSQGIDVLFDLNGHTGDNRLDVFALKAAPIQVSYIGYPCTTGLKTIDYRIVDELTDLKVNEIVDYQDFCSEKLIKLQRCFLCFSPLEFCRSDSFLNSMDKTREELKKKRGNTIHIACFNNVRKISDDDLMLWKAILKSHRNAKIFLKDKLFGTPEGREFFLERCKKMEIDLDQLVLSYILSDPSEHLLQYNNMDFAIDPIHYNGTTTTCEAMIMGVPMVVHNNPLLSLKHASNVGASLLHATSTFDTPMPIEDERYSVAQKLKHNCCHSQWYFIERCCQLIENPSELKQISGKILSDTVASSTLCDEKDFFTHFSKAISQL